MNKLVTRPTGTTLNPVHPETAEFYDEGQYAYILKSDPMTPKPSRVVTSFGSLGLEVGTQIEMFSDATGARTGTACIAGIIIFKSGTQVGEVPDRKLAHSVVK